jgi:hypothetical protein
MKQENGYRLKGMSVMGKGGYDHRQVSKAPIFLGNIGRPMPTDGGVVESQVVWQ